MPSCLTSPEQKAANLQKIAKLSGQRDFQIQSITPDRFPLVDRFYRAHGYKLKYASLERVFVISTTQADSTQEPVWIGAVRLVPQPSGHFWLRNLLVAPAYRGKGLAAWLLDFVIAQIAPAGCYCFALPHLTSLYSGAGFEIDPSHCPTDICALFNRYKSRGRDWILMGVRPV